MEIWILITLVLALVLGGTLHRLVRHRRALGRLQEAIRRQQPFLREDVPGASGVLWDELCLTVNERIIELRQLQQQRRDQLTQLEATLGSLQEAVLVVDERNVVLLANRALEAIFPQATHILNERVERVLQSADFLTYVEAVRHERAQPQQEIEFYDEVHPRWVEITGTLIPAPDEPKRRWALFVLHDITKQKRLEMVRRDFVANVSHELRTPLSVIKGYVETLVEEHAAMSVPDRDHFLRTTQRHTERLQSLLDDLLLLSRLESGSPGLRPEVVSMGRMLEAVVADYRGRPAAGAHQIALELDPGLEPLRLDPLRLTQVFENLLDNALKYTPAGSEIRVTAHVRGGEVVASVGDNGPGIPPEDLPHIFERFYRVDKGRSRDKGGTGLGLSIAKHIVQLHGGRIWAESVPGQGSTIGLALPVEPKIAPPRPPQQTAQPDALDGALPPAEPVN